MPTYSSVSMKHSISAKLLTVVFAIYFGVAVVVTLMHIWAEYIERSSVGTISQSVQKIGACLPSTLSWAGESVKLVMFLSDELFAKSRPILVIVAPQNEQDKTTQNPVNPVHPVKNSLEKVFTTFRHL